MININGSCPLSDIPENFLTEENRKGYIITHETKKIWACQLQLVSRFMEVCRKYGLRFWLDSGSLLGAVRHKGYIPWDDDIDIVMFREEYDRLLEVAQQEFKSPIIFQTAYTERNFVRGHAQMRDTRTSAIIPQEIYKKFNQGIFIDIFVLDGVSSDDSITRDQARRARSLRYKLEIAATPLIFRRHALYNMNPFVILGQKLTHPVFCSSGTLYSKYEDIFRETRPEDCEFVDKSSFSLQFRKIDKHIYDNTIYMDFEYMKLPVPAGYDKLLTIYYGDYMKPVEAPSMHGEVIFDTDTPADIKVKELRKRK